jgi:hypothetical protein
MLATTSGAALLKIAKKLGITLGPPPGRLAGEI